MRSWIVGTLLLSFTSCVDTLDPGISTDLHGRLVVEGFVERGDYYHFLVSVSNTLAAYKPSFAEPLSAEIDILLNGTPTISLTNGQSTLIEVDRFHQMYGGQPENARFRLRVTSGGETYESTDQRIWSSPGASALRIHLQARTVLNNNGKLVDRDFVILKAASTLRNQFEEKVSLRWEVSGEYIWAEPESQDPEHPSKVCYLQDERVGDHAINLVNAHEVLGDSLPELDIDVIPVDSKFSRGYYYTVLQKTLSPQATEYWTQVAKNTEREGSIFDTPAGQTTSNITNVQGPDEAILGYFYGTALDTIRLLVQPHEVGSPRTRCEIIQLTEEERDEGETDECDDCLDIPNSTDKRPHYWPA